MFFLLQKEKRNDTDYYILKETLDGTFHDYEELSINDFKNDNGKLKNKNDFPKSYQDAIPLGTINFVTAFLNIFKNIEKMNPIEIPKCLRTNEFLKRKYSIQKGENLPQKGRYFIKNASNLKTFSYQGPLEYLPYDEMSCIVPNDFYQLSEIVNILSEYRVYIVDGEVYAISHYDGNPNIFPDVNLIKKANLIYSTQPDYPRSYTMDIMVNEKGTSILEIHPLFSCGLYTTLLSDNFLYGYKDSLDYITKYNTQIEEFSNF